MKGSERNLANNQQLGWINLPVVGLGFIFSLLLLTSASIIFQFPELINANQVPLFVKVLVGFAVFMLVASFARLRKILRTRKKFKKLKSKNCDIVELEVLDRFTYIKLLPGKESTIEFRYFVKTAAGNWQLAGDLQAIFARLQPGVRIRAAAKKRKTVREILDLEILSEAAKEADSGLLNRVTDKVASEVKVTGYRNGQFLINKSLPLPELKYYLVVNNKLQLASGTAFSRTRLNQIYYEGLERANTIQKNEKDKYVVMGLPAG